MYLNFKLDDLKNDTKKTWNILANSEEDWLVAHLNPLAPFWGAEALRQNSKRMDITIEYTFEAPVTVPAVSNRERSVVPPYRTVPYPEENRSMVPSYSGENQRSQDVWPSQPGRTWGTPLAPQRAPCAGLENSGATCYLNSLLQNLFHLAAFRKAVYSVKEPTGVALALQHLFVRLQLSSGTVSTRELTEAFGWNSADLFTQHDVQELTKVLFDALELQWKGTPNEKCLDDLFHGRVKNFIRCTNIDYESSRVEIFSDLSLQVRSQHNVIQAFRKYCEVEKLDGDNQYMAEGHGLQDATKGVKFVSLPAVLYLHLLRFEYDLQWDRQRKVHDRFEFAERLDLNEFVDREAGDETDYIYHLRGVFIHMGDVYGGHYYTYIKGSTGASWRCFDDETVTYEPADKVERESFGSPETRRSAYVLVYVRSGSEMLMDELVSPPPELRSWYEEELDKERAIRAAAEMERKTAEFGLLTANDVCDEHGSTKLLELWDFDGTIELRIRIELWTPVAEIYTQVASLLKTQTSFRIWELEKRPSGLVTLRAPLQPNQNFTFFPTVRTFWIEMVPEEDRLSSAPASDALQPHPAYVPLPTGDVVCIFKLFEPATQTLRWIGTDLLPNDPSVALLPQLQQIWENHSQHSDDPLSLNGEDPPFLAFNLSSARSVTEVGLFERPPARHGDIFVLQQKPSSEDEDPFTFANFVEDRLNAIEVRFERLDWNRGAAPNLQQPFTLRLSRRDSYEAVAVKVAAALETQQGLSAGSIDPDRLLFTAMHPLTHKPKPQPCSLHAALGTMLEVNYTAAVSDQLLWELLEVPRGEFLANYKRISVYDQQGVELKILTPKDATVGQFRRRLLRDLEPRSLGLAPLEQHAPSTVATRQPPSLFDEPSEESQKEEKRELEKPTNLDARSLDIFLYEVDKKKRILRLFKDEDSVKELDDFFLGTVHFVVHPALPADSPPHLALRVVFYNTSFEYNVQLHQRPFVINIFESDATVGDLLPRLAPYLPREEANYKYAIVHYDDSKERFRLENIDADFLLWRFFQNHNLETYFFGLGSKGKMKTAPSGRQNALKIRKTESFTAGSDSQPPLQPST